MISLSRIKFWNVMIICSACFRIMLNIIMLLFNKARVLLLKTEQISMYLSEKSVFVIILCKNVTNKRIMSTFGRLHIKA